MSNPTPPVAPVVLPFARALTVRESGKGLDLQLWGREPQATHPQGQEAVEWLLWKGSLPASAVPHGAAAVEGVAAFGQFLHERFPTGEQKVARPHLRPSDLTATRNRALRRVQLEEEAYGFLGEALPPVVKGFGLLLLAQWPRTSFQSFPREASALLQAWEAYQLELSRSEQLLQGAATHHSSALLQAAYSPAALLQGAFYLGILLQGDDNSRVQLATLLQGGGHSVQLVQNFCHWESCRYALGALPAEKQARLVQELSLEVFTAERDYLKAVWEVAALLKKKPGELILAQDRTRSLLQAAALPREVLVPTLEGWSTTHGTEYLAYLNRVGEWYLRKEKPAESLRLGDLLQVVATEYRNKDSWASKRATAASLNAYHRESSLDKEILTEKLLASGLTTAFLGRLQQQADPEKQRQLAVNEALRVFHELNIKEAVLGLLQEVGEEPLPETFMARLESYLKQPVLGSPMALNDAVILLPLLRRRLESWQQVVELIFAYAQALQGRQWALLTWWEFLLDIEQYKDMPAPWVVSLMERSK